MIAHPPRLACVKHAASVRPEPGSNSPREFNKARPNWLATVVAVSPNHFLVRQCSLPGHLIVCPDRRVRLALPSTLNPVVKQRIQTENPARSGQPTIVLAHYRSVKWIRATFSTCSDRLNSNIGASFRCGEGTPMLAASIRTASGRNTLKPLRTAIPDRRPEIKCSVMDSNHQPSD